MKLFGKAVVAVVLSSVILSFCACDTGSDASQTPTPSQSEEQSGAEQEIKKSDFRIIYEKANQTNETRWAIENVQNAFEKVGYSIDSLDGVAAPQDKEIIIGTQKRQDCANLTESLSDGEFAIETTLSDTGEVNKIIIAYKTSIAFEKAIDYFIENYIGDGGIVLPSEPNIKKSAVTMITAQDIDCLRDPFILYENNTYYAYGTGWGCFKNTGTDLSQGWEYVGVVASIDSERDGGDHWAPEVHKYNGEYYMFTTYKNKSTEKHGCTILKSSSPEGPFVEITGGAITPADWDCIDGTLYIDPDGQPWMVYVREWISAPQGNGSFVAQKLSGDLTQFTDDPIELFHANEPSWATMAVTDGCFMYTTESGELLMLWSNFSSEGYVVAIARSDNGRIDGNWTHDEELLYSKSLGGTYDGGHAMIFYDTDGQMFMSFHSPNTATSSRKEKPVFIALKEENNTLVWTAKD